MVAIEYHHCHSPRRWEKYRALCVRKDAHTGRAEAWRLIFLGLILFWALFAYGIHAVL